MNDFKKGDTVYRRNGLGYTGKYTVIRELKTCVEVENSAGQKDKVGNFGKPKGAGTYDQTYYVLATDEVQKEVLSQNLRGKIGKIDPGKLTVEQMKAILKITEDLT